MVKLITSFWTEVIWAKSIPVRERIAGVVFFLSLFFMAFLLLNIVLGVLIIITSTNIRYGKVVRELTKEELLEVF